MFCFALTWDTACTCDFLTDHLAHPRNPSHTACVVIVANLQDLQTAKMFLNMLQHFMLFGEEHLDHQTMEACSIFLIRQAIKRLSLALQSSVLLVP